MMGKRSIIASRVVSVGLVNKTQVHPREVFADPITDRASAVIVAHKHPSGSLEPSKEDHDITAQLRSAGEILGMRLLDHIVFNPKDHHSFLESFLESRLL
jgi:DNA repair protein RadC